MSSSPLLQACRAQVRCPSGTGYFRDRTVRFRAVRARPSPRLTPRSPTLARFLLSQLKDVTRKFKDNSAVVTKYHEMSDKLHASIAEKMALKAEVAALEEQLAARRVPPRPRRHRTLRPARLRHVEPHLRGGPRVRRRDLPRRRHRRRPRRRRSRGPRRGRRLSRCPPSSPPRPAEPAARAAVVIARRGAESAAVFAVRAFDAAVSELAARARHRRGARAAGHRGQRQDRRVAAALAARVVGRVRRDRRASVWE